MERSFEREGWLGGKLDLVWTFMVCIDDSAWFLKAWLCLSCFPFLVIFEAFSWRFSCGSFEAFLFGIWSWTLRGFLPFDSPWAKGLDYWVFLLSRVRGILGGISSNPIHLASFGGPNPCYGVAMRCSYYPQSLVRIHGVNREIGSCIYGSWPACCCSSREPRSDQSDWCLSPAWPVLTLDWILLGWTCWRVPWCLVWLLFRVWFSLELGWLGSWIWCFLA
jgi:hypothetical protein